MPLHITGEAAQQVSNYKYLRVTIEDRLQWSDLAKNNKRIYFLRKLTKFHVDKTLITLFYRSTVRSVLSV